MALPYFRFKPLGIVFLLAYLLYPIAISACHLTSAQSPRDLSAVYSLAEVVQVAQCSAEQQAKLNSTWLIGSRSHRLTETMLKKWVQQAIGTTRNDNEMAEPAVVDLTFLPTDSSFVSVIEKLSEAHLIQLLKGFEPDDLSVERLSDVRRLHLPDRELLVEHFRYATEKPMLRKRMGIIADFFEGTQFLGTETYWFSVELYRDALVAQDVIPKQSVLSPSEFSTQRIDLAAYPDALTAFPTDRTLRLKNALSPGHILRERHLYLPMAVTRQQAVTIYMVSNGVQIEASGKALSEGQIGEPVTVQTAQSSKPFSTTVVGHAQVRLGNSP